jgi:peroxiredoxin family protein
MTALSAASLGAEVNVFATMDGVQAFRNPPVLAVDSAAAKLIRDSGKESAYVENFRKAKSIGRVTLAACSMASELFGIRREDYASFIDSIEGVTTFMVENEGATLFQIW